MVRIDGPKIADLRVVSERFEKIVQEHLHDVLTMTARAVTSSHSAIDDVATIPTLWAKIVRGVLLGELEQAFWFGVNTVHLQMAKHLTALTAAVNPDDVLGSEDPPGPDIPFDFPPAAMLIPRVTSAAAQVRLANRQNMLVGIGDEAFGVVRDTLLEGMQAGEGVLTLRDRVLASIDVSAARAQVIARTEVNQAANAGSLSEMRASGIPAMKEWIATDDDRTRPDHAEADGQQVALDEMFEVGGESVDGPDGEINCRCTVGYSISEEDLAALDSSEEDAMAADASPHIGSGEDWRTHDTEFHLSDSHDQKTHGTPASKKDDSKPDDMGDAPEEDNPVNTKAMIALIPCDADLSSLTVDGGEPREQLHLTLVFLGEAVDYPPELRATLISAVAEQLNTEGAAPIAAHVYGAALWNADGDKPAWVVNVGDQEGSDFSLRQTLSIVADVAMTTGCPMPEQHTPWSPHICIAYSDDAAYLEKLVSLQGDILFDRVRISFAHESTDIQLVVADSGDTPGDNGADLVDANGTATVSGTLALGEDAEPDSMVGTDMGTTEDTTDAPVPDTTGLTAWSGCLVIEGEATGDGREFAPDSITWPDPQTTIIPLRWNKEDSHGGEKHTTAVNVGRVNEVWRDGNKVMGSGTFNTSTEDGSTAWGMVRDGYLGGVSIDADDIAEADVEYVWPEGGSTDEGITEDDDLIQILFGSPEKMIFHSGRIRGVTLCDIPAFVEASIELIDPVAVAAADAARLGAVVAHITDTSDGAWDDGLYESRLPVLMSEALAKTAYAWLNGAALLDGVLHQDAGEFLHHEVLLNGTAGAANLTACSKGIGVLYGGRGGTTIPEADQRRVYDHLARHLRDGGQEPPPFVPSLTEAALLAGASASEWRPVRSWFENPKLTIATPIVVTDDGRVHGHAAEWGMCHIGYASECVTAPFENDFPYFMTGTITCDTGERLAVGQIVGGIGHAPLGWSAGKASEHYDDTDYVVADVVIGNDKHGIWVAGAVRPWVTARQIHELRASGQVSPDWRSIGGSLRMVGLLVVSASGFQTRRARALIADGQMRSLISSGFVSTRRPELQVSAEELDQRALRLMRDKIAARVGITRDGV